MVVVLGIDSDARGSAALLDTESWTLDLYALPNQQKRLSSGKTRLQLDSPALAATMADLTYHVDAVWIEDQWSRPGQDVAAMFTFGQGFGDIRTAVAAGLFRKHQNLDEVRSAINFVSAADWKLAMRATSDKAQTRERADLLFPECKHAWKLVSKHTSAAEASLLALYGVSRAQIRIPKGTIIRPQQGEALTQFATRLT